MNPHYRGHGQGQGNQPPYAPPYQGLGARPSQPPPHQPAPPGQYYALPPQAHPQQWYGAHPPAQQPAAYYPPQGGYPPAQPYPGGYAQPAPYPPHAPQGYGAAPVPVPHAAPHLPAQFGTNAAGPPAVGYVQPANAPPQTYNAAGAMSQFRGGGRKRALLIGINYSGSSKLQGCVRDVTFMTHLLRTKFGFNDRDFFIMTDKPHGIQHVHSGRPTRKNILEAMRWLVKGASPGDSLFFHFSGHGSQVRDTSGDEADGYDETILPMDYQSAGHIVDDEIYDIMVRRLPRGVRLTSVMDCCHSGTGMDLPYIHDGSGYGTGKIDAPKPGGSSATGALFSMAGALLNGKPQNAISHALVAVGKKKKKPAGGRPTRPDPNAGEVLLFSGCRDNQVAADTSQLAGVVTGAMTYCVIEAIERGSVRDWRSYTYRSLLQAMREKLRAAKLKQTPQFSTSHPFDLGSPFIV